MRGLEWNCFVTLFCSVLWSTEETNKKSLEKTVQRMGKEAVQWGLVAGVYTGMTYGMQEARGVHDWVCINSFLWASFPLSFHVDLCCREYCVMSLDVFTVSWIRWGEGMCLVDVGGFMFMLYYDARMCC
jgi:hypothetical protein